MGKIKCLPIRRRLSAFLDEEIPASWKEKVKIHLSSCPTCQQELRDLQKSVKIVTQISRPSPPSDLWLRIEKAIRNKELAGERGTRQEALHWLRKPVTLVVGSCLVLLVVGFILGNLWRRPTAGLETYLEEHNFSSLSPLSQERAINVFLTGVGFSK
jgi:hypothetical protein